MFQIVATSEMRQQLALPVWASGSAIGTYISLLHVYPRTPGHNGLRPCCPTVPTLHK